MIGLLLSVSPDGLRGWCALVGEPTELSLAIVHAVTALHILGTIGH